MSRKKALYAKWDLEDIKSLLENEMLEAWQKSWYKELGIIIFGFALQEI